MYAARVALACLLGIAPAWASDVDAAARRHGLAVELVQAVVAVESGGDSRAVSPKGAMGLMQLMPATAARFGVTDPFDAEQSLEGGCAYLRWLLDRFDGSLALALAAYNAGEGAVERHGGVPPYAETRQYVSRVLAHLQAPPPPALRAPHRATSTSLVTLAPAPAASSILLVQP